MLKFIKKSVCDNTAKSNGNGSNNSANGYHSSERDGENVYDDKEMMAEVT